MKTGFEALTISYWLTKVVPSLFLLLVLLSSASLSFSSWSVNGSEALLGFSVWYTNALQVEKWAVYQKLTPVVVVGTEQRNVESKSREAEVP